MNGQAEELQRTVEQFRVAGQPGNSSSAAPVKVAAPAKANMTSSPSQGSDFVKF